MFRRRSARTGKDAGPEASDGSGDVGRDATDGTATDDTAAVGTTAVGTTADDAAAAGTTAGGAVADRARTDRAAGEGPDGDAAADGAAGATRDDAYDRSNGPWDLSEVPAGDDGRIDLGGIRLPGAPGMELRVEIDQESQQIGAVAVVLGELALQVQPFAAPRSRGEWTAIRGEIAAGVIEQGGTAQEHAGVFGTELVADVPLELPDAAVGRQTVRFVGIDGPRWFLRGVFSGPAVGDPAASGPLEEVLRGVVVVRGGDAMAPREPIPLRLPPDAAEPAPDDDSDARDDSDADERDGLRPFERGPEITETR